MQHEGKVDLCQDPWHIPMTKTAIIFNYLGENIEYFVVSEDLTRFQGVYINTGHKPVLEHELVDKMFDDKGRWVLATAELLEFQLAVRNGATIVECGQML